MIGTILGNRYEIIEKIGEGGMAEVYKAKCQKLNRYDAVKILKKEFIDDINVVEKFTKEATALANLSDNNIVNVLDVGKQDDIHYIVMEYVKGKTLKQIIRESGKLSYDKVIDYGIQIARALDCAHRNNIIHRDVKPQNILVTGEGIVKVTDFGIAKSPDSQTITNTSKIMGSAHYFSPEQAKGNYVDYRSDIYSFGVVLYEMVTGKLPFDAESPVSVALKHIQEPVVPPNMIDENIPHNLNKLILKAMEKEPIKRYQNVKEILNDLLKIQKNLDVNIETTDIEEDFTRVMKPISAADLKKHPSKNQDEEDEDDEDEYEDEDPKKKKKKYLIFSLIGVLVVALGVMAAAFLLKPSNTENSGSGEEVVVPKIVGLSQEEAKAILKEKGLDMEIGDEEESDDKEAGIILKVFPGEGETAKGKVRVIVSSGTKKILVPDLKDMDPDTAASYLEKRGLKIGETTKENSDTVTKGNIMKQNPAVDTEVKKGDKVNIVISDGPQIRYYPVPDLINKTRGDAESLLKANKLKLGNVSTKTTNDKGKDGLVESQSIQPGVSVQEGNSVSITIWEYKPEKIKIPSLAGKTINQAKEILKGLELNINENGYSNEAVIKAYTPNGEAEKGATIKITEVEIKAPDDPKKP